MSNFTDANRRHFLQTAVVGASGLAAAGFGLIETAGAQTVPTRPVSSGVASLPLGTPVELEIIFEVAG